MKEMNQEPCPYRKVLDFGEKCQGHRAAAGSPVCRKCSVRYARGVLLENEEPIEGLADPGRILDGW